MNIISNTKVEALNKAPVFCLFHYDAVYIGFISESVNEIARLEEGFNTQRSALPKLVYFKTDFF